MLFQDNLIWFFVIFNWCRNCYNKITFFNSFLFEEILDVLSFKLVELNSLFISRPLFIERL